MFRPTRRRKSDASRFSARLTAIRRDCLDSALACGRSSYPNEFGGLLRSEEAGVITELLLLPGTTAGRRHANFLLYMLPADLSVVGTVHSHPSGALHPSDADLRLFRHWGSRHVIVGYPYSVGAWRAYDGNGEETHLAVRGPALAAHPPALPTYQPPTRPAGSPTDTLSPSDDE